MVKIYANQDDLSKNRHRRDMLCLHLMINEFEKKITATIINTFLQPTAKFPKKISF